ncbi:P-loop NTPase family protein [Aporhodopirellula aestuarii]|uniref:Uncharacterized protein n=1 Tax=Aporhodopirellula aestuarii TaxID=2950107 RepID=A0ABT0U8M1_9BACT|nr:hypothetical protein [Aporhodopirellula aestuarii]MCM2373267.1 hypothetical protein [Aporhodopirellula aestuarii]
MAVFTRQNNIAVSLIGAALLGSSLADVSVSRAAGPPQIHSTDRRVVESRVESYLDALGDDSHATRQRAVRGLLQLAGESQPQQKQALIQSLLRRSLFADFETQLSIERLVDEIEILSHNQNVERVVVKTEDELRVQKDGTSALISTWQMFSSRAGAGDEAREAFRRIASQAGPSLSWPRLSHDLKADKADLVLISHLGCIAPQTPKPFKPQSQRTLAEMKRTSVAAQLSSGSDANSRVAGRLVDRTLIENSYGWTFPERLHLALLYDREPVARELCQQVMRCDQPLAVDLAVAILAFRRIARRWTGEVDQQINCLNSALGDRRVVCVAPEQLVGRPRKHQVLRNAQPPNIIENQPLHRRGVADQSDSQTSSFPAILRTRVQDVAAWALVQETDFDVRGEGLIGLQADPVWGTRLSSIGFVTEWERTAFLTSVRTYLTASSE